MRNAPRVSSLVFGVGLAATAAAQSPDSGPSKPVRELGAVDFARNLDRVLATPPAKPLFLLFQEIPG